MRRHATLFIAIHCSDTYASQDIGVKEIRQWHTSPPRNWSDIGYHYVIRRDGTIEAGRLFSDIGAHVEGYNARALGICMVGGKGKDGKPENNFTLAQWESLRKRVTASKLMYPSAIVQGHRDFPGVTKACPCFDAKAWWAGVLSQSA